MSNQANITDNIIADQENIIFEANENNCLNANLLDTKKETLDVPPIETLGDIFLKADQIVEWCNNHPITDHIYTFTATRLHNAARTNCIDMFKTDDTYIAGSYALHAVIVFLNRNSYLYSPPNSKRSDRLQIQCNWESNDIDIFLLNKEHPACNHLGGNLDIVSSPEKSIEELLRGFDLPICRVAMDLSGTFYVSIQAMNSLITKKMNVPIYLKDEFTGGMIVRNYCERSSSKECTDTFPSFIMKRFHERIKKYSGRGYGINWIKTTEIVEWIKLRSAYLITRLEEVE